MPRPLWKSTIVIWSDVDPSDHEISYLAREAERGDAYCSRNRSEHVPNPTADPDWDGTEFFGDPGPESGEPGGACADCWGTGIEHIIDPEYGRQPSGSGDKCEHCGGTGVEPPEPEDAAEWDEETPDEESDPTNYLDWGSEHLRREIDDCRTAIAGVEAAGLDPTSKVTAIGALIQRIRRCRAALRARGEDHPRPRSPA